MKMKKFMNAPETVTDEELTGLGWLIPTLWMWMATWSSARTWPPLTA